MYIDLDFAYDEASYAIDDASKKAFAEDGFIIVRYVSTQTVMMHAMNKLIISRII